MYTLEMHLKRKVDEAERYQPLLSSFNNVKEKMRSILPMVFSLYPHYSGHDLSHVETIIIAIERILGEDRIRQLSVADTWLILCAAYFHDIGMIVTHREELTAWKSDEFKKYLQQCSESNDAALRKAATLVRDYNPDPHRPVTWPADIKQNVILLSAEYFRRKHPGRVSGHIAEEFSELKGVFDLALGGFIHPRTKSLLAQIALMHGRDFEVIIKQLTHNDLLLGCEMHPRFAAVLLRLGDLCDVDNGRFNEVANAIFGELPFTSQVHYFKHESITRLYISQELIDVAANVDFKKITKQYAARCREFSEKTEEDKQKEWEKEGEDLCHRVILEHQRWFDMLENELKNAKLNWHQVAPQWFKDSLPHFTYEILADGKTTRYSDRNIRFQFPPQKVFALIEGYSLYDDPLTFVRELIQNSMDAMKLQLWREIVQEMHEDKLFKWRSASAEKLSYSSLEPFSFDGPEIFQRFKIDIKVETDLVKRTAIFSITDNGIGISSEDVQKRLLNTGVSWEERDDFQKEFKDMPSWLRPTGSFGIGLHSVFVVTDRLTIRSKTRNEAHCNTITMHSGKQDGFVFLRQSMDDMLPGTVIEMEMDLDRIGGTLSLSPIEDPFQALEHQDMVAPYIASYINRYFVASLFPIAVNKGDVGMLLYQNSHFLELFLLGSDNQSLRVKLSEFTIALRKDCRSIVLWDSEEGAIFHISFYENTKPTVSFKGVFLEQGVIHQSVPWLFVHATEVMCGKARDVVIANRQDFLKEKRMQLHDLLVKATPNIAKYFQYLLTSAIQDEFVQKAIAFCNDIIEKYHHGHSMETAQQLQDFINEFGLNPKKQQTLKYSLVIIFRHYLFISIFRPVIKRSIKPMTEFFTQQLKLGEISETEAIAKWIGNTAARVMQIEEVMQLIKDLKQFLFYFIDLKLQLDLWDEIMIELGRELGRELGSELGRELGRELGSDLEQDIGFELGRLFALEIERELGLDFGREVGQELRKELWNALRREYDLFLQQEFRLRREIGLEFGLEFGREYGREFNRESKLEVGFGYYIENNWHQSIDSKEIGARLISVLVATPLFRLFWFCYLSNQLDRRFLDAMYDFASSARYIEEIVSISDHKSLLKLLINEEILCKLDDISDYILTLFPFLRNMQLTKICVRNNIIYVTLGKKDKSSDYIEASDAAIITYLQRYLGISAKNYDEEWHSALPSFSAYRSLAILPNGHFLQDDIFRTHKIVPLWLTRGQLVDLKSKCSAEATTPDYTQTLKRNILNTTKIKNLKAYILRRRLYELYMEKKVPNASQQQDIENEIERDYERLVSDVLKAALVEP